MLSFTFNLMMFFGAAFASKPSSIGKAYSNKGKLLYIEKHYESFSGDRLISLSTEYYKSSSSKKFASLYSDFRQNHYVPTYKYEDSRLNRRDGVRHLASLGEVAAFAKADNKSPQREKNFKIEPNLISGQGLYSYFHKNFDKLLNMKQPIFVEFLIPMNLDKYKFKIEQYSKTKDKVTYRIKFKNWILRMFAPYIEVVYAIKTRRLLQFRGPSNVPDDKGKMQNVVIKYDQ